MDMRVARTYKNLVEAFEKLLQKYKYEEITVSMLCDKSMLRRTTFYKHFRDKDDFFNFYMLEKRKLLEEVCGANENCLNVGAYHVHMLDSLMSFFIENEAMIDNMIKNSQGGLLLDSLADFMISNVIRVFQNKHSELNEVAAEDAEYFAIAITGATLQTIKQWWMNGHKQKDRLRVVRVTSLLLPLKH